MSPLFPTVALALLGVLALLAGGLLLFTYLMAP